MAKRAIFHLTDSSPIHIIFQELIFLRSTKYEFYMIRYILIGI